jgi:signal transduction histidine kinase
LRRVYSIQEKARTIIRRQAGNLVILVNDLLEVSRILSGRIQLHQEDLDARGVAQQAVETARPVIDQNKHELTVSLPPEPIWLHADALRLEEVIVNLLNNAAKYTPEGGHIWLNIQQEADEMVLRVRDTGIGIARDSLRISLSFLLRRRDLWIARKVAWVLAWQSFESWWRCTEEQSRLRAQT